MYRITNSSGGTSKVDEKRRNFLLSTVLFSKIFYSDEKAPFETNNDNQPFK